MDPNLIDLTKDEVLCKKNPGNPIMEHTFTQLCRLLEDIKQIKTTLKFEFTQLKIQPKDPEQR